MKKPRFPRPGGPQWVASLLLLLLLGNRALPLSLVLLLLPADRLPRRVPRAAGVALSGTAGALLLLLSMAILPRSGLDTAPVLSGLTLLSGLCFLALAFLLARGPRKDGPAFRPAAKPGESAPGFPPPTPGDPELFSVSTPEARKTPCPPDFFATSLPDLPAPGDAIVLEPDLPVPAGEGLVLRRMYVARTARELHMTAVFRRETGEFRFVTRPVTPEEARAALHNLRIRRTLPVPPPSAPPSPSSLP